MLHLYAGNASEWTGPTGNNTYLFPPSVAQPFRAAERPVSILVDAGVGHPDHIDAIERALAGAPLDVLLITHGHTDHAAGVPALKARWPALTVRGGPGEPLRDGEVFQAGAARLRALHTPGHAPDHFCFVDDERREVYCGDLARIGGTVVIPASRGGNLREYLASLNRVRALNPARLLPAHGPAIEEPSKLIDEYLAHRRQRDEEVKAAIAAGCRTPEEIVARIYPGLSPALLDAARETVLAHLAGLDGC